MNDASRANIFMTTIERLHVNGILRRGSPSRGFKYKHADGKRVTAEELARIEALKIPPAWTDVAINSSSNGRVQAVGKDAAGRWQYIYHESHVRTQQRKKFERLIKFGESLPAMRKTLTQHLKQPELSRERVMAAILRILSMSFMRPGSDIYANENGSYGIATLRPRHVSVKADQIVFEFRGKAGKDQRREIRDRQVSRVLKELLKHSNRRVFKYQSEENTFVDVKSDAINRYVKELMGHRFTAKDFRTWAGTLICACALARIQSEPDRKQTGMKRKIKAAINEAAEALGNTPAVSRDAYICPAVLSCFEKGEIIVDHFENMQKLISYRGTKLHPAEQALLRMLKKQGCS